MIIVFFCIVCVCVCFYIGGIDLNLVSDTVPGEEQEEPLGFDHDRHSVKEKFEDKDSLFDRNFGSLGSSSQSVKQPSSVPLSTSSSTSVSVLSADVQTYDADVTHFGERS